MKPECLPATALLVLVLLLPVGCEPATEEVDSSPTEVTVQVGTVVRTTLRGYLDVYGFVAPQPASGSRPAGAAYLAAPTAGIVLEVPVAEGQVIRAGDLIVRLDDRIALAEVDRAQASVRFSEQTLERETTLLAQHNTSTRRFEEAQQAIAMARADLATAEGALAQVQLRSPLDGVVSRVDVAPGQSVDPKTVVAEIVDLRRLTVSATVPTGEAMRVRIGQQASVTAGGAGIPANVSFISSTVDPATGTVLVRLAPRPDSGLRPGQFVRVRIVVDEHPGCLAVPRESVHIEADGHGTLSVVENDTAYRKEVQVGLQDGALIEVDGASLREGMTVVTVGSFALPEETRVRVLSNETETLAE